LEWKKGAQTAGWKVVQTVECWAKSLVGMKAEHSEVLKAQHLACS